MPLIKCEDCGNDHSDAATACPKCGRPNTIEKKQEPAKDKSSSHKTKLIAGIIAGAIINIIGINPYLIISVLIVLAPIVMLIERTLKPNPVLRGLMYATFPFAIMKINDFAYFIGYDYRARHFRHFLDMIF